MAKDRFFIAPYNNDSGLESDVKPFLIPDQAFSQLNNAYVFRGRVRKRFGSRWLNNTQLQTRFRMNLGNVVLGAPVNIPPGTAGALAIGQMFSIGADVFTVYQLGAGVVTYTTSATIVATIDSAAVPNTITITVDGAGTALYYYPSLPVMGLRTMDQDSVNQERIIGFDTRFAYEYVGGWEREATENAAGDSIWSGSNFQFFWTTTWTSTAANRILFVTNFNPAEANFMRYFDGITWFTFNPATSSVGGWNMNSARILVPFKNRLLAFNTYETEGAGQLHFPQRVRWSKIGSPLDANAWHQNVHGLGNGRDAPTTEAIITVEFIRDRLIVFFEKSTWELVYTGDQVNTFVWQQINTELGAESTFSIIPLDKIALGVGNVGIHACNGINVERIDAKIPDFVSSIHNTDGGVDRVYGIRDYQAEMIYWTLPAIDGTAAQPFPDGVLVYNYVNNTWSLNNDAITAFGYYQSPTGITWASLVVTWAEPLAWTSGYIQAQAQQVIAGNQEGYTFIIDFSETVNCSALQITNIATVAAVNLTTITMTIVNHNLRPTEFMYLEGITGGTLTAMNGTIQEIIAVTDANTIVFSFDGVVAGPYTGSGIVARVSKIDIKTKQFNFYAPQGQDASISSVNFLVDRTTSGQVTVDYLTSSDDTGNLENGLLNGMILGTNILETSPYATEPAEQNAERLWHPIYFNAEGNVVQFQISMSTAQMRDTNIREADFQLHAMAISAQSSRNRLQ